MLAESSSITGAHSLAESLAPSPYPGGRRTGRTVQKCSWRTAEPLRAADLRRPPRETRTGAPSAPSSWPRAARRGPPRPPSPRPVPLAREFTAPHHRPARLRLGRRRPRPDRRGGPPGRARRGHGQRHPPRRGRPLPHPRRDRPRRLVDRRGPVRQWPRTLCRGRPRGRPRAGLLRRPHRRDPLARLRPVPPSGTATTRVWRSRSSPTPSRRGCPARSTSTPPSGTRSPRGPRPPHAARHARVAGPGHLRRRVQLRAPGDPAAPGHRLARRGSARPRAS